MQCLPSCRAGFCSRFKYFIFPQVLEKSQHKGIHVSTDVSARHDLEDTASGGLYRGLSHIVPSHPMKMIQCINRSLHGFGRLFFFNPPLLSVCPAVRPRSLSVESLTPRTSTYSAGTPTVRVHDTRTVLLCIQMCTSGCGLFAGEKGNRLRKCSKL